MFEDEQAGIPVELDDENVTEEDILMFSTYPGPRVIVLNDAKKTNILGLVLDETDDSFLVGLPAKAVKDKDDGYKITPLFPVPYIRMMKSSILTTMYTFDVIDVMYKEYLDTKGREIYPEVAEYIDGEDVEPEPVAQIAAAIDDLDISLTKDETEGNKVLGMTDDELKKYLTDKYNNGELSSGSRKKQ